MTATPIELSDLERARLALFTKINQSLPHEDTEFMIAFKNGDPDWEHFSVSHIRNLPAVK